MPYYPNVPRCQHLKVNGTQCGSPALTRNRFCFFPKRFQDQRVPISATRRRARASFDLLVLEDANAIQVSLVQTMRLLVSTSCNISHEYRGGVKLRASPTPICFCLRQS
jgi:hypothetical protein